MKGIAICMGALVIGLAAAAQDAAPAKPFPRYEGKVLFQDVVPVDKASSPKLYARAKAWIGAAFSKSAMAVQIDDQANGVLVARVTHDEYYGGRLPVGFNFTITIEVRDGRYRWSFDQIEYDPGTYSAPIEAELTPGGTGVYGREEIFESFRQYLAALATDLEAAMKRPPPVQAGGAI